MEKKKIVKIIETVLFADGTEKTAICEGDEAGMGIWNLLDEAEANTQAKCGTASIDYTYIWPPDKWEWIPQPCYPLWDRSLNNIYNLLYQILQELKRDGCCKEESTTLESGELSSKNSATD